MTWIETQEKRTERPPEGVALHVAGERNHYVIGVDVGQKRDYTALAMVQRSDVVYQERSPVTWQRYQSIDYRLRFLERLDLDLTYTEIVSQIDETVRLLRRSANAWTNPHSVTLVVDSTGVGTAVTDMLKKCGLGCEIVGVTITGGERPVETRYGWNVPKKDLITDLQIMYEQDQLLMSDKLTEGPTLIKELGDMQVRLSDTGHEKFAVWRHGVHDDLVLAVALAVWRAKMRRNVWGPEPLIWGGR